MVTTGGVLLSWDWAGGVLEALIWDCGCEPLQKSMNCSNLGSRYVLVTSLTPSELAAMQSLQVPRSVSNGEPAKHN